MDLGSLVVCIKTEDVYTDIAKYIERNLILQIIKVEKPLPRGKK